MMCPNCNGSSFVKHGFLQGVQRFKCTGCSRNVTEKTFAVTYRHRFSADQIRGAVAMLTLTNTSMRAAATILKLLTGHAPSHVAVWGWLQKFKDKLETTSRSFRRIQAGRVWHIVEVFIKLRGSISRKDCSYLVIVRDQHGTILAVQLGHERDARLIGRALRAARASASRRLMDAPAQAQLSIDKQPNRTNQRAVS